MLSPAQILTLRNNILNDPAFNSIPGGPEGAQQIADVYNAAANPAFIVWRSSVNANNIHASANWDWARVDNLSAGKARIWEWLTRAGSATGSMLDFSKANVRAAVEATFSVESSDGPNRQAAYDNGCRQATRLEKLFFVPASGTGAVPTNHGVGPAVMGYEGSVSYQEVLTARQF